MAFRTKWIKVAQVGDSIDGRTISEKEITDMGQTYDPTLYPAFVWLEHIRAMGNYGNVALAKAEKDKKGVLSLYVQFEPSADLITLNRDGQKVYGSVEIHPGFPANNGRAYLMGLAATDSPAMPGNERWQFSARPANAQPKPEGTLLAQTRHEISFSAQEESEENRVVAFLRKHLNPLAFNKEFSTQQPTEEFDMTPEQLAALQAQMKAQADGLTALSTRVATLATEIKNMAKAPNADEAAAAAAALAKAEADKKAAAPKDFSAELAESLKAVNTSIADLKTQFAELAKKPAAGTTVTPEHGGGGAAFVAV